MMQEKDAKIFVISMKNISKKLEFYGDANINNINLLKLIYKYAKYFTDYDALQTVDKMVNYLQRSDRAICMEYTYSKGYSQEYFYNTIDISSESETNTAPTLTDITVEYGSDTTYQEITYSELFAGYSDKEGTDISYIKIYSIPATDQLFYQGVEITGGDTVVEVDDADLFTLEYVRGSNDAHTDTFTYSVFDSAQTPLESNVVTATINVEAYVDDSNEAPTIGDLALYVDNRESITITIDDILTGSDPDYVDPEGNQLDAIRIDRISSSNQGEYLYYGTAIEVDQIISYDDIVGGAFTYTAADINSIQTDVIEVSIRDTENGEWVSD